MEHHAPLFARQPIFDQNLKVVAYELLFRSGPEQDSTRGDEATSQVLLYAFGHYRIEDITGELPAYINFTRHWVVFPPPLPPQQVVVEVLEDVPPDKGVLDGLKQLRERGYRIALDDFFISPQSKAFLRYADVIKIDVLALPPAQLERHVKYLRPLGVELLAEKIESHASFERCRQMGFDYFQGYFLSKPHIIEGMRVSEARQAFLRQLARVLSPDTDRADLNELLASRHDIAVRLENILMHEAPQHPPVTSADGSAKILDDPRCRVWLAFLLLIQHSDKPAALWNQSLTRAEFCARACQRLGGPLHSELGFKAGLLSNIDAALDLPLEYVVAHLNPPGDISKALLEKSGEAGCALDLIEQLETANWLSLSRSPWCDSRRISEDDVAEDYREALAWSQRLMELLGIV